MTRACRCDDRNEPDWREVLSILTSLVRMYDIIGRDLTSRVGQGSMPHCLLGAILSRRVRSGTEIGISTAPKLMQLIFAVLCVS